jgi:hypothetical protein
MNTRIATCSCGQLTATVVESVPGPFADPCGLITRRQLTDKSIGDLFEPDTYMDGYPPYAAVMSRHAGRESGGTCANVPNQILLGRKMRPVPCSKVHATAGR